MSNFVFLKCTGYDEIDAILQIPEGMSVKEVQNIIYNLCDRYESKREDYSLDDILVELPDDIKVLQDYSQCRQIETIYY